MIKAEIPRVKCSERVIMQISVSWAEKNSRFTIEFESAVILWLKENSIKTVAANFGISRDEANGTMERNKQRF